MLHQIDPPEIDLYIIGMVKDTYRYRYNGQMVDLGELRKYLLPDSDRSDIIGSLICETPNGIPIKLVFIRHRSKKNDRLVLASSDFSLKDKEFVRIYDMLIAHTMIVFARYILLEWERRHNQDLRSFGELFFICCKGDTGLGL